MADLDEERVRFEGLMQPQVGSPNGSLSIL